MQSPIVSYIIPYYNGQDTIERQLDSIYSIPLEENELEVIVVDDCSPIPAETVLNKSRYKYKGLRIVRHENNLRQGGAKNTGIRQAKGDYIAFADQDDVIDPVHIKDILVQAILEYPDIILCQARRIYCNDKIRLSEHPMGNGEMISGVQFCEKYYNAAFSASPWSNFYRRQYLLDMRRPMAEKTLLEDVDWVQYHLFYAQKLMNFNYPIYNWHANMQSITHSNSARLNAAYIAHGYRKIENSKLFRSTSSHFADVILEDGQYNVSTGFRSAWKVPHPWKIFDSNGCGEVTPSMWENLSQLKWDSWTGFFINNRAFTSVIMTMAFPLRWAIHIKRYVASLLSRHTAL